MIPAQPVTTLEMFKAQFVLQFPIIKLDPPGGTSDLHIAERAVCARSQLFEPVPDGFLCLLGPFDQQPLRYALRMLLGKLAVASPDLEQSEPRLLRPAAPLAPTDRSPS